MSPRICNLIMNPLLSLTFIFTVSFPFIPPFQFLIEWSLRLRGQPVIIIGLEYYHFFHAESNR